MEVENQSKEKVMRSNPEHVFWSQAHLDLYTSSATTTWVI